MKKRSGTKAADIGSKRLVGLAPDGWMRWVMQRDDVVAGEMLNSGFQWISRENDVLLRARRPGLGEFLFLNEFQLRYRPDMHWRMRAYAALAGEKYHLPAYPVLVNVLPPPEGTVIETRHESQVDGLRGLQDYRVLNLWEVDVNLVFQTPLPSLLPFVPVLRGGGEPSVIREALSMLRAEEKLDELEPLLAFFATFPLETRLVQEIMRWDMAVLRESPWYNEILNQGVEQGLKQGVKEGVKQGVDQGARETLHEVILDVLEARFGSAPQAIRRKVNRLRNLDTLKGLHRQAAVCATLGEFEQAM